MLDFISRMFGKDTGSSGTVAKERLRLVLVHDRASVSPEFLQVLKNDLIEVISKYMEIDENTLEVNLDSEREDQVALVANIPVKKMKRSVKGAAQ
jgi:cell division topological specificity factor